MNDPRGPVGETLLFSKKELSDLTLTSADRMLAAIEAGRVDDAQRICLQARNEHFPLHDVYMTWSSQTQSYVYKKLGLESLRGLLRHSATPWLRPLAEKFRNGVTREAASSLAQLVRTECFGTPTVEEDDDRVVFRLDQWSNERLVKDGCYLPTAPHPIVRVAESDVLTGFETNAPIYVTGVRMAELLMIEWLGYPAFVMDSHPDGVDRLVLFKNPAAVPQRYFDRVGAKPDKYKMDAACSVAGGRLFTNEELAELAKPYLVRATAALVDGDMQRAKSFCGLARWEWYPGHHLSRDWMTAQLTYLDQNHRDLIFDYFEKAYEHSSLGPMVDAVRHLDTKTIITWFSSTFQQHAMQFRIEEDADKFAIITEPCGSGGRLITEGAYDQGNGMSRVAKASNATFQLDNFPSYCMHCPATNKTILQGNGPYIQLVDADIQDGEVRGHCKFMFYKNPDAIPEHLYTQVGLKKPASRTIPVRQA